MGFYDDVAKQVALYVYMQCMVVAQGGRHCSKI